MNLEWSGLFKDTSISSSMPMTLAFRTQSSRNPYDAKLSKRFDKLTVQTVLTVEKSSSEVGSRQPSMKHSGDYFFHTNPREILQWFCRTQAKRNHELCRVRQRKQTMSVSFSASNFAMQALFSKIKRWIKGEFQQVKSFLNTRVACRCLLLVSRSRGCISRASICNTVIRTEVSSRIVASIVAASRMKYSLAEGFC